MFERTARRVLVAGAVAAAVVLGVSAGASAEVRYTITDLGGAARAYGMNDAEQVVGMWGGAPALWEDGEVIDLVPGHSGWAYDVNNSGQVVGEYYDGIPQAFLWEDGEVTTLGALGGSGAKARAINDACQIVGWASTGSDLHAFLYTDGVMSDLGTLGGPKSWALGINAAGDVVGRANTDEEPPPGGSPINRAFLYRDGTMTAIASDGSIALDINDLGQVVGRDAGNGFLWDDGEITYLEDFAEAWAINNLGQVVGYGGIYGYPEATLWEEGETHDLIDLIPPDSGWDELSEARDINDSGQIVGWGHRVGVGWCAFLLTPIPEPGAVLLLGVGGLALFGRRRCRVLKKADPSLACKEAVWFRGQAPLPYGRGSVPGTAS